MMLEDKTERHDSSVTDRTTTSDTDEEQAGSPGLAPTAATRTSLGLSRGSSRAKAIVLTPSTAAANPAEAGKYGYLRDVASKWRGSREPHIRPSPPPLSECAWSFLCALLSLWAVTVLHSFTMKDAPAGDRDLLIGSFGATAVLLSHQIKSPLAQPANLLGGHVLSAVVGVAIGKAVPDVPVRVAGPLAVASAIAVMGVTNTMHPPGGATALIAVCGSGYIRQLGFVFVLQPVLSGAALLLVCALVLNNINPRRRYPLYWSLEPRPGWVACAGRVRQLWSRAARAARRPPSSPSESAAGASKGGVRLGVDTSIRPSVPCSESV